MTNPAETVLAELRPGWPRVRAAGLPMALVLGAVLIVTGGARASAGASGPGALLFKLALVAAVMLGMGWFQTRKSHWQLTDRHLIDVTGDRSIPLAQITSTKRKIMDGTVIIGMADGQTIRLPGVPDSAAFETRLLAARDATKSGPHD
ncbi:MAG: hypothetical protein Q4G36_11495 [Paracoccus sp. (in: a-proteobacteria)]|nr:hypothetical protein [Paracoccus sp. (in: a-proteobacteria)]